MPNIRPTSPVRILNSAGNRQVYHVAHGPKPRAAVASLAKPEPEPLAPPANGEARETSTVSGLQISSYAGRTTVRTPSGLLHNDNDEPSVVRVDGAKAWNRYNVLHRFGGPAVAYPSGSEYWYENGEYHRNYGPAVTSGDDAPEYWVYGIPYLDQDAANAATAAFLSHDRAHNKGELERDPETLKARQSGRIDPRALARKVETRQAAAEDPRSTPETLDLLVQDLNRDVRGSAIEALSQRERWRLYAEREAAGSGAV